ncbi:MAG TPA: hypothetical protein VGE78_06750 [Agromyces sp.]
MIRLLCFGLLGAVIASATAWAVSGDDAWVGLFVPCVIAFSVLTPIVLALRSMAGAGLGGVLAPAPTGEELARAESEGRLALARVRAISRTGTSINDQPVCDLDLVVVPRFGSPFEVRTRRLVDLVEIPRLQPECVVVVAMQDAAPSPVSIVMDPPDEWVRLAQSDERVRETRTAPAYLPAPSTAKTAGGLRRIHPAFYVVAVLAGAALALIPAYPTISAIASGETTIGDVRYANSWEGRMAADERARADAEAAEAAEVAAAGMFVGDNAAQAVDALVAELGSPQVVQLAFWGDRLAAVAPSAPGAMTLDSYGVLRGDVTDDGPAGSQPEPGVLDLQLFDATTFDASMMPELIARAKELSGLPEADPTRDQWVYVSRSGSSDDGPPPVGVDVPVYGEYYDAWVTFSLDGEVVSMRGGAPGSASYEAEHADD